MPSQTKWIPKAIPHERRIIQSYFLFILEITVHEGLSRASASGNLLVPPHLVAGCGLRYLGGEHYKSLGDVFGMSETSVQRSIDKFIEVALECPEMDLKVPAIRYELQQSTNDFTSKFDAGDIFRGCVGCIDGWLCCVQLPRMLQLNSSVVITSNMD